MTDTTTRETQQARLHGVVPIPVTTFDPDGSLDLGGLRSQVDFCLDSGADGILYPGVVSEFYTLTDDERRSAVETVVDAVAGRAPVPDRESYVIATRATLAAVASLRTGAVVAV